MNCPFCGHKESKVIDSRPTDEGNSIRRRRECEKCRARFTTYEKVEMVPLVVIKSDRSREPFDRRKILSGLMRACTKRPITTAQLEDVADKVENAMAGAFRREFTSREVGEMILAHLRELDEVAYIRFASVYRSFDNIETFSEELNRLKTVDD